MGRVTYISACHTAIGVRSSRFGLALRSGWTSNCSERRRKQETLQRDGLAARKTKGSPPSRRRFWTCGPIGRPSSRLSEQIWRPAFSDWRLRSIAARPSVSSPGEATRRSSARGRLPDSALAQTLRRARLAHALRRRPLLHVERREPAELRAVPARRPGQRPSGFAPAEVGGGPSSVDAFVGGDRADFLLSRLPICAIVRKKL